MLILIAGREDTGKTSLACRIANALSTDNVHVDLDSTGKEVAKLYDVETIEPEIMLDENLDIDHYYRLNEILEVIKTNKSKVFILDGTGTFLTHCEYVMRVKVDTPITDDLRFKYWIVRNQLFNNTLTLALQKFKHVILVAHSDFLIKPGDEASKLLQGLYARANIIFETFKVKTKEGQLVYAAKAIKHKDKPWLIEKMHRLLEINQIENKIDKVGDDVIHEWIGSS